MGVGSVPGNVLGANTVEEWKTAGEAEVHCAEPVGNTEVGVALQGPLNPALGRIGDSNVPNKSTFLDSFAMEVSQGTLSWPVRCKQQSGFLMKW